MTAATIRRSEEQSGALSGPRPVDPRRDMAQIADLIKISFADRLDAAGRRMVQEMRTFGRAGWLGWLVGRFFLPPAAYPLGYVWREEGRVVGNASVLPVEEGSERWVMANVAVHPAYRRRGIARELVRSSLELARRRGAAELVLQVDHDNRAALSLYEGMDFSALTTRTSWVRSASGPSLPRGPDEVAPRRKSEWPQQWSLAQELFPEGIAWPYPLSEWWFEPSNWPGFFRWAASEHGVVRDERGDLLASATARFSRDIQAWRLALLVPTDQRGELEAPLLTWLVKRTASSGMSLSLSYPVGPADDQIRRLGFRARRTLTWMGRDLTAAG